ncbi:hypothetical protein [Streptomyces hawaiiensis]|uniref:hypothetical protein n=1 Tax=Streptomyces hawaiiensis TaxID=67305 RepID=UPI00365C5A28
MKTRSVRWLLAPVTQWRVHRLMADQGHSFPYEAAWTLVRLGQKPEELPFAQAAWRQAAAQGISRSPEGMQ